jgi:DNA-directed RNA polymerase subunit delta
MGAIQAYILKKTKYMDKFMTLKGKLDMVSNLIEIKKTSAKPVDGDRAAAKGQPLLVYKDADDYEDKEMGDNDKEEDDEDFDNDEDEDEDEEIKEIDIKTRKRPRTDKDGDEESDEDMEGLDDSVTEEEADDA